MESERVEGERDKDRETNKEVSLRGRWPPGGGYTLLKGLIKPRLLRGIPDIRHI